MSALHFTPYLGGQARGCLEDLLARAAEVVARREDTLLPQLLDRVAPEALEVALGQPQGHRADRERGVNRLACVASFLAGETCQTRFWRELWGLARTLFLAPKFVWV